MGSLDSAAGSGSYKCTAAAAAAAAQVPVPLPRASSGDGGVARRQGVRSKLAHFLLVDTSDGSAPPAAFFCVTILVVAFLLGSVVLESPTMLLPTGRASGGAMDECGCCGGAAPVGKGRLRVSIPPASLPLQFERILPAPRALAMAVGILVDFPAMAAGSPWVRPATSQGLRLPLPRRRLRRPRSGPHQLPLPRPQHLLA